MEIPIQLRVGIKTGIDIQSVSHLQNWKINPDQNKYLHQRHFESMSRPYKQRLSKLINIDGFHENYPK
ncbi:MAG: hypothetical protein IPK61_07940 [Saprospiraceae bacterium]|nr:hypothetical protein [Saprospiraceae bacterium]